MAWEQIENLRRGNCYGASWDTLPAVSISKTGLTINKPFCDAFVNGHHEFLVLVDTENRKVGLRTATPQDTSSQSAFRISENTSKGTSSTKKIQTVKVGKIFPDCIGKAFRAHLNAGERVIEVDLSPENMLR